MDMFDERIHERCHFDMRWMCAVCAHFIQRGEVCHNSEVVGAGQMHLIHANTPDVQLVNLLWQRLQMCQSSHSIIRSDLWLKLDQNDVPNHRCLPLLLHLHVPTINVLCSSATGRPFTPLLKSDTLLRKIELSTQS